MKKFFAIFICVLYLFGTNICFAFSELYYLKNINQNAAAQYVQDVLYDKDYDIKKKNPFYAISTKDSTDYAAIVLQQSGANLFYYFESNDENKRLNKNILKEFKRNDIEYEQSSNQIHLANFSEIAQRTMTGEKKVYIFEEPKMEQNIQVANENKEPSTTLKGFAGKIGKGEELSVYLQTSINTATAQVGDSVCGVLKSDWTYKNYTVAPQGSILYGSLTKANHATAGSRNGSVRIVFDRLVTPEGKTLNILSEEIDFSVTNEGKVKSTLTKTLAIAAVGAILGVIIGAISGDGSNIAQGALIGAGIGGGSALVTSVAERGVDAEIPAYTDLQVVLDEPVDVVLSY